MRVAISPRRQSDWVSLVVHAAGLALYATKHQTSVVDLFRSVRERKEGGLQGRLREFLVGSREELGTRRGLRLSQNEYAIRVGLSVCVFSYATFR
jgi:hypothetical protein